MAVARNGTRVGALIGSPVVHKAGTVVDGRSTKLVIQRAMCSGQGEGQRTRKRSQPPANPIPPTAARHRLGGAVHLPGVTGAATSKRATNARSSDQRVPTAGIGNTAGRGPNAGTNSQTSPRTERRHDDPIPRPATAARESRLAGVVSLRTRATATVAVGPSEKITANDNLVGRCANGAIPTTATASREGASLGPVSLPLPLTTIPNRGVEGNVANTVEQARNAKLTAKTKAIPEHLGAASDGSAQRGRG